MQRMHFRAKNAKIYFKPMDFLKRNFYFETEGVLYNSLMHLLSCTSNQQAISKDPFLTVRCGSGWPRSSPFLGPAGPTVLLIWSSYLTLKGVCESVSLCFQSNWSWHPINLKSHTSVALLYHLGLYNSRFFLHQSDMDIWRYFGFRYHSALYIHMQEPSYLGKIVLVSVWFGTLSTQLRTWVNKASQTLLWDDRKLPGDSGEAPIFEWSDWQFHTRCEIFSLLDRKKKLAK